MHHHLNHRCTVLIKKFFSHPQGNQKNQTACRLILPLKLRFEFSVSKSVIIKFFLRWSSLQENIYWIIKRFWEYRIKVLLLLFIGDKLSMGCSTSDLGQRMSGTEFQSLLFYHLSLIFISLILVYFKSGQKETFPIFNVSPSVLSDVLIILNPGIIKLF